MLDRTVLKEHQMFLVCDGNGDIAAHNADGHGLYWHDTRFLSLYELSFGALAPAAAVVVGRAQLHDDAAVRQRGVPDARRARRAAAHAQHPPQPLPARRACTSGSASSTTTRFPVPLTLSLTFGSDFRDMFDMRGYARRSKHGAIDPPRLDGSDIVLGYTGLRRRSGARPACSSTASRARVEIARARPAAGPDALESLAGISGAGDPRAEVPIRPPTATAVFELDRAARPVRVAHLRGAGRARASRQPTGADRSATSHAGHRVRRLMRESYARVGEGLHRDRHRRRDPEHGAAAVAPRPAAAQRSRRDGYLPSAGIPWFSVPFGRDSLITSMQTLLLQPDIARGHAALPGRAPGPARSTTGATRSPARSCTRSAWASWPRSAQVPHTPYYGSVDATPLFLMALGEYVRWTGDCDARASACGRTSRRRWTGSTSTATSTATATSSTVCRSSRGIRNQGWKDSADSVDPPRRSAGRAARSRWPRSRATSTPPGCDAPTLFERLGEAERARRRSWPGGELRAALSAATGGRTTISSSRWRSTPRSAPVDDGRRRTPGHCLWTGLLDDEHGRAVGARLRARRHAVRLGHPDAEQPRADRSTR